MRRVQPKDRYCVQELDAKFEQYEKSINPDERKNWPRRCSILENYYFVPVFRHAFVNAIGPRIAAERWQDVFQTITRLCLSLGRHQAADK